MVRVVLIDDEEPALADLCYLLKQYDAEILAAFTNPEEAYDALLELKPDVVFLDIDMPVTNGIELGVKMQSIFPEIILVFVTAYSRYALEAFKAYPLDYMLKPVNEERLVNTLEHIKKLMEKRGQKRQNTLRIRCFGRFEVSNGSETVKFPTQKARELLAYLLCNAGQPIYRDELIYALFGGEDEKKGANNLRVTLYRLRSALTAAGLKNEQISIREDYDLLIQDRLCDLIDLQRFFDQYKSIDRGNIDYAERIIALYTGDLLSDIDALWVIEKREWARIQVEDMIIKASLYYISERDIPKAERILLQLIETNPLAEQGYVQLLNLYMEAGALEKFSYYYTRYARIMEEELESTPEPRYTDFYESNCR